MNELDKKTCIQAVSTFLKAIQIFQKFYVAWTLCNLISEIYPNKVNKYDKERINCSYNCTCRRSTRGC